MQRYFFLRSEASLHGRNSPYLVLILSTTGSFTEVDYRDNCSAVVICDPLLCVFREKCLNKCLDSRIICIFCSYCNDVCIRAVSAFAEELVGCDACFESLVRVSDEEVIVVLCRDDLCGIEFNDLDGLCVFNDVVYRSAEGILSLRIKNDEAVLFEDPECSVLVCTVVGDSDYCSIGDLIY